MQVAALQDRGILSRVHALLLQYETAHNAPMTRVILPVTHFAPVERVSLLV
jgi:hypothetical protein